MKIAVTGTIGSGKSTVSILLKRYGMHVFDCDSYSRIAYLPQTESYHAIVDLLGDTILEDNGEVDRAKVASIVFQDDAKRQALNAIVHPVIKKGLKRFLSTHEAEPLLFAEVPILFEVGWDSMFDYCCTVTCSKETAIERLMQDRAYTRDQAEARMKTQMPLEEKKERSDKVLWNDGSIQELDTSVKSWLRELRQLQRKEGACEA